MSKAEETAEPTNASTDTQTNAGFTSRLKPNGAKIGIVAAIFSILWGALAAWALANTGLAAVGFIGGVIVGWWALANNPTAKHVARRGLYVAAPILALGPTLFYVPTIIAPGDGASGAGTFIGSIMGLVIWTIPAVIIAGIMFAAGYFISRQID
ncbi:hypothetical protein [Halomicrococcus sp. NG-SE-24]|uniref:hypothetical protein n=1 Tax=Halomicrococcus sp. NG-SE-24 TaxID=3436928 RepID=UPI003D9955D1